MGWIGRTGIFDVSYQGENLRGHGLIPDLTLERRYVIGHFFTLPPAHSWSSSATHANKK
jgi:hypothetical protein